MYKRYHSARGGWDTPNVYCSYCFTPYSAESSCPNRCSNKHKGVDTNPCSEIPIEDNKVDRKRYLLIGQVEKAKEFVMTSYGWSRERVETYPLCDLLSMVAARDVELYDDIRKDLRKVGYIV